tara:strand:- start:1234 stop:2013 length:780 start_codon:yes stop_codon:yes gene_type:complete
MSEHKEFLPPSPSSPRSLTEENLEKHQLHLDTTDLPTPPPTPAVPKNDNVVTVPATFKEHKAEVFEESQRLLDEVHVSEKLVNETHEILKNEVESEKNAVLEDMTNLANLVALLLSQDDRMKKYNLPISHEAKLVLSKLLSIDHYFDDVEEIMNDIVRDNKIDARDVPKIMLLLTELYKMLQQIKDVKFDEKLCGEILKTLFNIALKEQLIPIAEQDIELLKCLYDIVDTSITLMQTDTSGEKKGIIYHLKKCFNSCKK